MLSYLGTARRHSTQITRLLTTVLANEFALYSKTKKTYWAFSGKRFTTLLQILREQCFDMEDNINKVAELLRKLNGKQPETWKNLPPGAHPKKRSSTVRPGVSLKN